MPAKLGVLYAVNTHLGLIDQVVEQNVDPGIEELVLAGNGAVDPSFAAVMQQAPGLRFTTTAIKKALDFAGINGVALAASIEFFFQQVALDGTRSTGLTHNKVAATNGILFPRSIRASQDSEARVEYEAVVRSTDPEVAPITFTKDVALSGSAQVEEAFTIGIVKVNGVEVEMVEEITIDFGVQELRKGFAGSAFPTFAAILERKPVITVRSLDTNLMEVAQLGVSGKAQNGTPSEVYFRRILEGGTRVAKALAQHIRFQIFEGYVSVRQVGGSQGEPLATEIKLLPTYDGTNDVVGMNTASAIP